MYMVCHRLKKVPGGYNVKLVFSAKNKIGSVCSRVKRKFENKGDEENVCRINHPRKNQFVTCTKNVVYRIPLACSRVYVGQTARCVNTQLREHLSNLKGRLSTHLAMHCQECACTLC